MLTYNNLLYIQSILLRPNTHYIEFYKANKQC